MMRTVCQKRHIKIQMGESKSERLDKRDSWQNYWGSVNFIHVMRYQFNIPL